LLSFNNAVAANRCRLSTVCSSDALPESDAQTETYPDAQ
jgi:hypothetical protein